MSATDPAASPPTEPGSRSRPAFAEITRDLLTDLTENKTLGADRPPAFFDLLDQAAAHPDFDPRLFDIALQIAAVMDAQRDDPRLCQIFLDRGASPNARGDDDPGEQSLLCLCVSLACPNQAQALLAAGADPNFLGPSGRHPLLLCVDSLFEMELARALLQAGAHPDGPRGAQGAALLQAALKGSDELARLLISRGARADLPGPGGELPWQIAAGRRHHALAEFLQSAALASQQSQQLERELPVGPSRPRLPSL